jgi:predicted nucleic acid-binding Zn ribbon protein
MERAGRLIGKLKIPKGVLEPDDLARTAWPTAVGRKIAAHTRAIRLVRGHLIVECEDGIWQQHLHTLSRHVLANLHGILGPGVSSGWISGR